MKVWNLFSYFTVIGSKLIKHKAKYHVSITSQGYDEPQVLEVAIRNSKKDDVSFEISKNVTLGDGIIQNIVFDVRSKQTNGAGYSMSNSFSVERPADWKLWLGSKRKEFWEIQTTAHEHEATHGVCANGQVNLQTGW